MGALARFAMRGEWQGTLVVAAAFALHPLILGWIGAILLALMVLRKGLQKTTLPFFLSIAPLLAWTFFWSQEGVPKAMILLVLLAIISLVVMAGILRFSESWQFTLMFQVGYGVVCISLLWFFFGDGLRQITDYVLSSAGNEVVLPAELRQQLEDSRESFGTQFMATYLVAPTLILLCAARRLQAVLYNPGGFQLEMHEFRLSRTVIIILGGLAALSSFLPGLGQALIFILLLPFVMAALTLVHGLVKKMNLPGGVLIIFYVVFIMLSALMLPLFLVLVFVDSIYDFRKRVSDNK